MALHTVFGPAPMPPGRGDAAHPHKPIVPLASEPQSLERAIDDEIVRVERAVATAGAVMVGVGLLLASYVAIAVDASLGLKLSGFLAAMVAWFLTVRTLLGRGIGRRVFLWVSPLV